MVVVDVVVVQYWLCAGSSPPSIHDFPLQLPRNSLRCQDCRRSVPVRENGRGFAPYQERHCVCVFIVLHVRPELSGQPAERHATVYCMPLSTLQEEIAQTNPLSKLQHNIFAKSYEASYYRINTKQGNQSRTSYKSQ